MDLDAPDGSGSSAFALNARGDVVGSAKPAGAPFTTAMLWRVDDR